MQLSSGQTEIVREFGQVLRTTADKHSNFFDLRRHLAHDLAYRARSYVSQALLVENKSQRIRASFNRGSRILEIRDSTNFYPRHETRFSVLCWFTVDQRLMSTWDSRSASARRSFNVSPGDFAFIKDSPIRNAW